MIHDNISEDLDSDGSRKIIYFGESYDFLKKKVDFYRSQNLRYVRVLP